MYASARARARARLYRGTAKRRALSPVPPFLTTTHPPARAPRADTWTPVFCAAVSYDSKMDASLLVRAADVKAHALVERMHACMTEVKVANELFAASAVEGGARGADNRRVSNLGLQDHQPSRKKEG